MSFHEGWYFESIWSNLALMFGQYLSFMLAFMMLAAVSIAWPRVGGVLHIGLGMFALWFFDFTGTIARFAVGPLVLMALAYWFGRPQPRRGAKEPAIIAAARKTIEATAAFNANNPVLGESESRLGLDFQGAESALIGLDQSDMESDPQIPHGSGVPAFASLKGRLAVHPRGDSVVVPSNTVPRVCPLDQSGSIQRRTSCV